MHIIDKKCFHTNIVVTLVAKRTTMGITGGGEETLLSAIRSYRWEYYQVEL